MLSQDARYILERMEADRRYDAPDLRAFIPDANTDRLRAIMHELWIARQVERVGTGWRRHQSTAPHVAPPGSGEFEPARPEDLFDHATFADFFK